MADIQLRAALAPLAPNPSQTISVDAILHTIGVPRPVGCGDLVAGLTPLRLTADLHAGTCHGSCEILVELNGQVTYTGHVHNNGVIDARYTFITSIPVPFDIGGPILLAHEGSVGGTFSPFESRDDGWQEITKSNFVRDHWWSLRQNSGKTNTQFSTGTGLFEVFMSALGTATPTWIFRL